MNVHYMSGWISTKKQLHDAGFRVSLANPHRSREFARGMGIMTKTDKVDAYMLACYAFLKKPHHWEPPAPEIRYLGALLRRRDVLLGDALREENRLEKYLSTDTPAGGADRETLRHIGPEPTADVENRPPQLRAKLYMSALCGKIYNKRMRNIYDEMCLRGKPKMVAIGALMRKLVHWCYGVLKTGTVFNDEDLKPVLST